MLSHTSHTNCISAHILSLSIIPCTVMGPILFLYYSKLYIIPLTLSLEQFSSALPTSCCHYHFAPVCSVCLFVGQTFYIQVSACIQVCLCVELNVSPLSTSLLSPIPVCCFSSRSALSSLPPNSSHLSFLLCFHFLSILSLSPSHLPPSISYFPLCYFLFQLLFTLFLSVISHLSFVYLCLVPALPLLC